MEMTEKTLLIGIGACGNKAAIDAIECGVIDREDVVLANTTLKDVPEKYKAETIIFEGSLGGAGKEPELGHKLALNAMKEKKLDLKAIVKPEHLSVTIVFSAEGGSGCGGAPIIAEYVSNVLKLPLHLVIFLGFREDTRGLKNTIGLFKKLKENFDVQIIENSKFLKDARNSTSVAEKLANKEFCYRLSVMQGNIIVEAEQNIDNMDLFKVNNTAGLKEIAYTVIEEKIKSREQFDQILSGMVIDSKSIDIESPSQQRMAVIINMPEDEIANMDTSLKVIKEKYGEPFEYFKHIGYVKELPRFVAFICSGFKLPIETIEKLNNEYLERFEKVSKEPDDFYSSVGKLKTAENESRFDFASTVFTAGNAKDESKEEEDFFSSHE